MDVLVPFAADRPKTRLSDTLGPSERVAFAEAMLADVLAAIDDAGADVRPHVLATADVDDVLATVGVDAAVTVDDRDLTTAVNDAIAGATPLSVVMSDLALARSRTLRAFFDAAGDVVVAPGRGGGTNALVIRHADFRVDYHGASFLDHLRIARDIGATVREFDSHLLATDVDERRDLAELFVHGEGAARDWLIDAGFDLAVETGRASVVRR